MSVPRPVGPSPRGDESSPQLSVVVAAEHVLVGDAVAAAVARSGLRVIRLPWAGRESSPVAGVRDGDRGLLLTDLASGAPVATARRLLQAVDLPWLVLTDAARGPLWGSLLEAGARDVLPASTPLGSVMRLLLPSVRNVAPLFSLRERRQLVEDWLVLSRDRDEQAERLLTLSPRESQVLQHLHRGESVGEIASGFGSSTSTVRSQVKSLLRKLGVSSQLAAVAVYAYAPRRDRPPEAMPGRDRTAPSRTARWRDSPICGKPSHQLSARAAP